MTIFADFSNHIADALDVLEGAGQLPPALPRGNISVEPPRDPAHGDIATNAAMVLAKPAGTNPRALAELLTGELRKLAVVTSAEIAGPGFINLRVDASAWRDELALIHARASDYGRSAMGQGKRVNVEYVSANPTGPMHVGHCRGAVVGDALASLLAFTGHDVTREYYVNDAGGQVDVLARSAHLRYREALGESITIPEGLYPGDYLKPVGAALAAEFGDGYVAAPESEWLAAFRARAGAAMMDMIRADLAKLGIKHDLFSSEAELQAAGKPEAAEARLRGEGLVYDGMLEAPKGETPEDWEPVQLPLFRATQFGDDQDRPIKKSDGSWTYFGADLAYHAEKAARADAIAVAYEKATSVPLATARLCLQAIELAEEAARTGNKNSASDAGVGALLAKAGLEAAILNVRINLPSVREGAFKAATLAEISQLQQKSAGPLAKTLEAVEASLKS